MPDGLNGMIETIAAAIVLCRWVLKNREESARSIGVSVYDIEHNWEYALDAIDHFGYEEETICIGAQALPVKVLDLIYAGTDPRKPLIST